VAVPLETRLGAGTLLALAILGTLGPRGRHLPEPRVIVDELDLLAGDQVKAGTDGVLVALDEGVDQLGLVGPIEVGVVRVVRVPGLEVDEDAVEGLAVIVLAGNHVDLLELTKAEAVEDGPDTRLADVREHPRDADTGLTRLLVAEVAEVPQIVVHLANRPGARGDFLLGKVLQADLVRETRARGRPAVRNDGRLGVVGRTRATAGKKPRGGLGRRGKRARVCRRGSLLVGRRGRVAGGHFWFSWCFSGEVHLQNTQKSISIFWRNNKKVFVLFPIIHIDDL
jgi:hypothetical protein